MSSLVREMPSEPPFLSSPIYLVLFTPLYCISTNNIYSIQQHGTIHWLEIPVIDAARAAAFYTSVLGVSIRPKEQAATAGGRSLRPSFQTSTSGAWLD